MQIQGVTTMRFQDLLAVSKKFIQWDSLRNESNSQGKLMRFRCSVNHVCASHNIPVMFYRITNRVGDRVSLLTVCLETQNIFSAGLFRL